MKKLFTIAMVGLVAVMAGCTSIPTVEKMTATSKAVGYAAGLVANQTKIDDNSRNIVIDITNKVKECVPQTNETFAVAWTPIAQQHVDKLVADGKITELQGTIIINGFSFVVKGLDYIFDVKYPEARKYEDLVNAAIHGFTDGFLAVFKPANETTDKSMFDYDKDAYNYLKK